MKRERAAAAAALPKRARSRRLVITQVALAVMLLAGAGLTLKSFWRAQKSHSISIRMAWSQTVEVAKANYDKDENGQRVFDHD